MGYDRDDDLTKTTHRIAIMDSEESDNRGAKEAGEQSVFDEDVGRFTENFAAFSRIINSLQRKYLELQEEFQRQNDQLADANTRLVELSEANLAATEFLNSILNSLSAGVVAVDSKGVVTHCNPAAARILGVPVREVVGRAYGDFLAGDGPEEANAVKAAETGCEVSSVEKKITLPDGRTAQVSVSTSVLRDREQRSAGAVEVFHDITKMKRLEQELARLNTLAALGEMAATVAHEVRNPLSGIAGFAALLERDLDEHDPHRKTVRKIIRGVEALNQTVATLLNYTRFKEISRTEVRYVDFLRKTVERFRTDSMGKEGGVSIEVKEPDARSAGVQLELDVVLMRQVIFNILDNAVQVMDGSGTITLEVRRLEPARAVKQFGDKVFLGSDETIVETIISDRGPGIHDHDLERIFAPFFSTRPGGNGLGLAVVWKIMKAHGGEVFADDASGGGAAFHLLLPTRV
jgi:PAS domain S-box-containing protein